MIKKAQQTVLFSTGIEFFFFSSVAITVLCLGFSMRAVLITHWCFGCYFMFALNQGHSQCLMLCQWGVTLKGESRSSQDSWCELAKGVFHTVEYHAPQRNCGSYQEGDEGSLETRFGIGWGGEQLYCASLLFLGFYLSFFLFSTGSIIFYFFSIIKLLLSQPTSFIFDSPSYSTMVEG